MNLSLKTRNIWDKAKKCNCGDEPQDSSCDHKLCTICGEAMVYGAHESVKSQEGSFYRWNIDHIKPKSKGGSNAINNLQAVHVDCNRYKDDYE